MAIQTTAEGYHEPEKRTLEFAMGGSSVEAIGGIGAVVLAILGLAGVLAEPLAAVAVIAIGAALVSMGAAAAARYSELLSGTGGAGFGAVEFGGGITTELTGGLAGIVLGILALIGMVAPILIASAIIVFGATLLLASGETSRLSAIGGQRPDTAHQVTEFAGSAAAGGQVLVGLGAVVLGILGLVVKGPMQMTLNLVGILCLGASILFSGTAIAGRLMAVLRPSR